MRLKQRREPSMMAKLLDTPFGNDKGTNRRRSASLLIFVVSLVGSFQFRGFAQVRTSLGEHLDGEITRRKQQQEVRSLVSTSSVSTKTPPPILVFTPPPQYPVVDILSIGSKRRPDYLLAQRESFASHASVRHFFNATEADDLDDPHCDSHLTTADTVQISRFCKAKGWHPQTQLFMRYARNLYANGNWLLKKANPVGWMCAQRRPMHGLYKVFQHYFQQQKLLSNDVTINSPALSDSVLPDYLIVMDDDTYFNLEQFPIKMALDVQATKRPLDDPYVLAGCLVRWPIHQINFTFGFGGYGTVFNKASLQKLAKPIHCTKDDSKEACAQVKRNMVGEKKVFREGMSVLDLIRAYVSHQPYKEFPKKNWTDGFCMHSDWVLGYFVNYYNISRHTSSDPFFEHVPQSRMEAWEKSTIYRQPEGFCRNEHRENCKPDSLTCHYMKPEDMRIYTETVKQTAAPGMFRSIS
ncbi:expressed unknown protein [Seminavis robusta]|uniref:Uncharacterized protein n=1 Tax=Seminavis robusta TaxID=568900 RepID=A0A9N8HA29_9STRA|nr:expressed unknown protein [Seminavis robusta]|eukprot:Sro277_g106270.1 n/a (466) ;mRNA; r:33144-34628